MSRRDRRPRSRNRREIRWDLRSRCIRGRPLATADPSVRPGGRRRPSAPGTGCRRWFLGGNSRSSRPALPSRPQDGSWPWDRRRAVHVPVSVKKCERRKGKLPGNKRRSGIGYEAANRSAMRLTPASPPINKVQRFSASGTDRASSRSRMIRASNLSKFYGGKRALGPVSFEINDGETVGFLGLNGAGKTTALRILACDLRPSGGTIEVGGVDVVSSPHEVRKRIGFLPENPPLYTDMIVTDYLRFAGELRGMSKDAVRKRLPEVLEITDLAEVAGDPFGTLSHGFRQRVGVAQAIVHEPEFLILDEP